MPKILQNRWYYSGIYLSVHASMHIISFSYILHSPCLLLSPTRPHLRFDRRGKQGELVDRVEYHVGQAQVHVEFGNKELHQAREYQTKARKVGFGFGIEYVDVMMVKIHSRIIL